MDSLSKLLTTALFLGLFAATAFAGGGLDKQSKSPERLAPKLVVTVVQTDPIVEALLDHALLQSQNFYLWDAAALPSVPNKRARGRTAAANIVNLYLSATLVSAEQKSRSGVALTPVIPGFSALVGGSSQRTATEAVIVLRAMLPNGQIIAVVIGEGNTKGSVLVGQSLLGSFQRDRGNSSISKAMEIGVMNATQKLIAALNQLQAQQSQQ